MIIHTCDVCGHIVIKRLQFQDIFIFARRGHKSEERHGRVTRMRYTTADICANCFIKLLKDVPTDKPKE
jgi:hypothetical protein